jgi:hypothetical protein
MCRPSLFLIAVLVLAQAASEEFKAKEEFKEEVEPAPAVQPAPPRDGYWAPPPGEAGAARHAPRPGPGGGVTEEGENPNKIEIDR